MIYIDWSGMNIAENYLSFPEHIPSLLQNADFPSKTHHTHYYLYMLPRFLCRQFRMSNFWLSGKCSTAVLHWLRFASEFVLVPYEEKQCLDGETYMLHHSVLQVLPPFLRFLWIREHICGWAVGWALSQLLPIILHQSGPAHQLHSGELLQQVPGKTGRISKDDQKVASA